MPWLSSRHSPNRTGELSGAVVVRTPDDALKDTNVRVGFEPQPADDVQPHKSRRPAPSPVPSSAPSSCTFSTPAEHPTIPPDPPLIPLPVPVPLFSPILVSPPPAPVPDLASTIVTLETCTTTYKSTLATLCSRPSVLADYLISLAKPRTSTGSSIYSSESTDLEAYRSRLVAQGLLSSTSCSVSFHIFLDRPGPPYTHILAFLRTQSASPECPPTLPHALQLTSLAHPTSSSLFNAKFEALLELRDETAYIGLDSLHKLCTDEIRQCLSRHARGSSASVNVMMSPGSFPSFSAGGIGTIQSHYASVHSLHTLIEKNEGDSTVCADKTALKLVSNCSENTDQDDKIPISPLGFPTSLPATTIASAPTLSSASTTSLKTQASPPRHIKNSSLRLPTTTAVSTTTISTMKQSPKLFSSSSLYTPPPSANSSPGQTYISPSYLHHRKAESASVLPSHSPLSSSQHVPVPVIPGRLKIRGRAVTPHGHKPSPSVGGDAGSLPGWI